MTIRGNCFYDRLNAYQIGFRNGVLVDESDIVLWVILASGKFLLVYAGSTRKKLQLTQSINTELIFAHTETPRIEF